MPPPVTNPSKFQLLASLKKFLSSHINTLIICVFSALLLIQPVICQILFIFLVPILLLRYFLLIVTSLFKDKKSVKFHTVNLLIWTVTILLCGSYLYYKTSQLRYYGNLLVEKSHQFKETHGVYPRSKEEIFEIKNHIPDKYNKIFTYYSTCPSDQNPQSNHDCFPAISYRTAINPFDWYVYENGKWQFIPD